MIRVGAVNIDTSHPLGFAEVMEKDTRMRYVGVFNDSFRDDDEVNGFIHRFGLEKRCSSLEELADMCDIGFIHGCNWDDHLRCIMPFIEQGKPVFVDKPIAGNLNDCNKLLSLVQNGAVILGASSARYAYEIQAFNNKPIKERGHIVTVCGTSGVDEFNYGIHIVEAINGLIGSDAQKVHYIGRGEFDNNYSESYEVLFANGKNAIYTTFTGTWQPFSITIMTTASTYPIKIDSSKLYEALVNEICCFMEGAPNHLAAMPELVQSVKIMLAGAASRSRSGDYVFLDNLPLDSPGFSGSAFCSAYAAASGPMYSQYNEKGDSIL